MKSDWLTFSFQRLADSIKHSDLSPKKSLQFNLVLLEIFQKMKEYEALKKEDTDLKQLIFAMLQDTEKALELAKKIQFSRFFKKSL